MDLPSAASRETRGAAWSRRDGLAVALLVALVVLVYGQILGHAFIPFDDDEYIYANPLVSRGLTWAGLRWACTAFTGANWHPLTLWSHMLDCHLFGLNAGAHLAVNGLLHLATAVLLFLAWRRLSGEFWPSLWVAVLFAVHPLNVETVAWASQRKSLLSSLCFGLTLLAYARYSARPTLGRYLAVLLPLALGLLCKAMLVTVPGVLLLLDVWPLRRLSADTPRREWWPVLLEKLPLLGLAGLVAGVNLVAQRAMGAMVQSGQLPLATRLANALHSYVWYLSEAVCPRRLGVFYPLAPHAAGTTLACLLALLALTVLACRPWRRMPYLAVGWLWYLGMLLPVIGLAQFGLQARADRYAYLPLLGVFVALVWWANGRLRTCSRSLRLTAAVAAAGAVGLLVFQARIQASYWRHGALLFEHTLQVCGESPTVHNNLGASYHSLGRSAAAIDHFAAAVRLNPHDAEAESNWGNSLTLSGRPQEALPHLLTAFRLSPDRPEVQANLGSALIRLGRYAEGLAHLRNAAQHMALRPFSYIELGHAHRATGDRAAALASYRQALALQPDLAEARYHLAVLLAEGDETDAARQEIQAMLPAGAGRIEAYTAIVGRLLGERQQRLAAGCMADCLRLDPDFTPALVSLAWLRATATDAALRNGAEAVQLATRAIELAKTRNPVALEALAAAYAESGRFADAVATAESAIARFREGGDLERLPAAELRLELYRRGSPSREE